MGITDQRFLGHVVDSLDGDQEQTDLNETLLFENDQIEFIRSFNSRVSEPLLQYYIDHLDMDNLDYFVLVLNNLSKIYSLNYLKLYKYEIKDKESYIKNIIYTIIFIKIKLIYLIEIQKIEKDITRDEFEKFIMIEHAPDLLLECIKYIDADSYKKFITRLFNEVKMEFME